MDKILISLTSPSGGGKGYLKEHLKKVFKFHEPVVFTTRKERKDENATDRIFLSCKDFIKRKNNNELIFANEIYGNYYGFSMDAFNNPLSQIVEIHIKNAKIFRKQYPSALMICIIPRTLEFLKYRLEKRACKSKENFSKRIAEAQKELKEMLSFNFDYFYTVDKDNEDRICFDVETYIKESLCLRQNSAAKH